MVDIVMNDEKFIEFKKDLKRLLKKHDAYLSMDIDWNSNPVLGLRLLELPLLKNLILLNERRVLSHKCVCNTFPCECKDWE